MQISVINLDESVERLASISAQFERLGLAFTRFEAVRAGQGADFFGRYDETQYLANTGRTATAGEVACFASHGHLWRRCAELEEPMVILEDDARLSPLFPVALAVVASLLDAHGFIRLQEHGPARHVRTTRVATASPFEVHYYSRYPFGAMAYAISPRVARRFIDRSRVLTGPVDVFIKKYWEHGQPLFGLTPSPVENGELSSASTIERRDKAPPSTRLRVRRWRNKLEGLVARARFNAAVRAGRLDVISGMNRQHVAD